MLKPPEEHTTGSDEVPLGLVACCVGVEVPAAMYRREVSVCVDGRQRTQGSRFACDRLLLLVLVCGNAAHRCMAACAGAGWFEHPVFGLPGRGVKHIFL